MLDFLKKNWFLFVLPILVSIGVVFFPSLRIYLIIGLIGVSVIYLLVKVIAIRTYLLKNFYIVFFIFGGLAWGMVKGDQHFWKDYEEASIVITIAYTIFLYVQMWRLNKVEKKALLLATPALFFGMFFIGISGLTSVLGELQLGTKSASILSIDGNRQITLGLLCLGTLFYCIVNYSLSKGQGNDVKQSFIKSLQYSDFPVFITFLLLWITTFALKEKLDEDYVESFYGGAIAFQMIYSNIVWSFIDDPIIENHFSTVQPNNSQQTTK